MRDKGGYVYLYGMNYDGFSIIDSVKRSAYFSKKLKLTQDILQADKKKLALHLGDDEELWVKVYIERKMREVSNDTNAQESRLAGNAGQPQRRKKVCH
jgi:hypothetical protein